MTDAPSADDLARENAELRERNGELEGGLRTVIRRQAATEAGLDPDMARWIGGDTIEDAVADARKLASSINTGPDWSRPSAPPEAQAIQQHLRETHDAAAALNPTTDPPQED
jgi:hypothetical protein